MPKTRVLIIACAAIPPITAAVLGVKWLGDWPANRFGVVQQGVLYRGGQPGPRGLRHIIRRYGVKTVINLRGPNPGTDWYDQEREICTAHGVRLFDVSISRLDVAASGLKQFLLVASDPAKQPVYVHCEVGSKRTSYAAAAYRICVQGWSYDQAMPGLQAVRLQDGQPAPHRV